jgi:hypothetical protein
LVDIVVSNENLHEAFLFNRTRHVADIPEEVQRAIFDKGTWRPRMPFDIMPV